MSQILARVEEPCCCESSRNYARQTPIIFRIHSCCMCVRTKISLVGLDASAKGSTEFYTIKISLEETVQ